MIEWRVVPSYPWLEASYDGRIRRCIATLNKQMFIGRQFKGAKNSSGYPAITTSQGKIVKSNLCVHVLVCEAFHGPRPTPLHEVAHYDGVRDHNAANNLRWVTQKENAADRTRHGRRLKRRNHLAKLSEDEVIEIRYLKRLGFTGYGLAAMYAIDRNHANKIASGTSWNNADRPNDCFVIGILSHGS